MSYLCGGSSSVDRRSAGAGFGLVAALALLLPAAACDSSLERPTGLTSTAELELEAGVLSPRDGQSLVAGETVTVRVNGSESGGRLAALGFRVHSARPGHALIATEVTEFESGPVADSTAEFAFIAPDTLPDHSQLDIRGIVLGPERIRVESAPVRVTVLQCPASALWC